MIVDCHCHAGLGDGFTGPWDTEARLDRHLPRAKRAGIAKTVLFSTFHSDYAVANRQVARIVAADPRRFEGFAFVHAARDAGRIHELVREAVEAHGFRGIKLHRHDARITREVCEVARAFGLPVLYDVMGETGVAELVAREFPDVAFIIPHLGSFADDWRAQSAVIGLLVRYPNLYADTSAVRRFDLLQEAATRAPRKVLFGSDGPWLHPGAELGKVRLLGLPAEAERAVLGGNVLRLLGRAAAARGATTRLAPRLSPVRGHAEVAAPAQ
jgi:predicted TIM-barrel fold metal-dependent hydrolase